jgi:hypothetical protein
MASLGPFDLFPDSVPVALKISIYSVVGLHALAVVFWVASVLFTPKTNPYKKMRRDLQAATKGDKNA